MKLPPDIVNLEKVRKIVRDASTVNEAYRRIYARWSEMGEDAADAVDEVVGEKFSG